MEISNSIRLTLVEELKITTINKKKNIRQKINYMTTIYKVQSFSLDKEFKEECIQKRDQFITGNG